MVSLVLMAENERERQILNLAFGQQGMRVLLTQPTYRSYILVMQYMPDIIVIELPHFRAEQLGFIGRIRSYKRTCSIPIIGYGDRADSMELKGIHDQGVSCYIERPLTFDAFMRKIELFLKTLNKTIEKRDIASERKEDISLILHPDTEPGRKIGAMVRHIANLAAFPFIVAKVLKIAGDEGTGAIELARAARADPYIVAHLLKISNSVFFASTHHRINSVKDAIIRIGFMETRRIVMGMSVMKLFETRNKNLGFDRVDFWYHSLAVAIIAEHAARRAGSVDAEEAFLAGLLHDLGIILLDDYFPEVFDAVLHDTAQHAGSFHNGYLQRRARRITPKTARYRRNQRQPMTRSPPRVPP